MWDFSITNRSKKECFNKKYLKPIMVAVLGFSQSIVMLNINQLYSMSRMQSTRIIFNMKY